MEDHVTCAVCGDDNCHPVRVRVYPLDGRTEISIDRDGVRELPSDAAARQRGVSIVHSYECEGGHAFDVEYRFHKGYTLVTTTPRPEDHKEQPLNWPPVIWRD